MGIIELRQDPAEDIVVTPIGVPEGAWAEVSAVLFAYGGSPSGDALVLTPLFLRLAAFDLGELLIRHELDASYDDAVRQLLEAHFQEVQARLEAERDPQALGRDEIRSLVSSHGRFGRDLTETQIRDLGRLLKLAHGANFSVPGAGKTTALLAIYEACKGQGLVDTLLVVAPKNAFLSWEDEVLACYPDETERPRIARIAGGQVQALQALADDPEIALITYQFLPNVLDAVTSWARSHLMHIVL